MSYNLDTLRGDLFGGVTSMVIEQLIDVARNERTGVIVTGLSGSVAKTLHALEVLQRVPDEYVVETLDEARQAAHVLLRLEAPAA